MKQHLLLLLFCLLSSVAWTQEQAQPQNNDSLRWEVAAKELQAGHYEKACSLYMDVNSHTIATYQDINSRKVEDLRNKYSIDEVQLQRNLQQSRLLRLMWIAGIVLVTVFIGCVFHIRKQNRLLARSREEMNRAKALAEESIRNKSLFLSNMSHEIKTPLNALSGFAEVLTMPGIDEGTREQCNDIIQLNSELLLKLINDVIDISCLDVANMKFCIKSCDVVALGRNVVKTLSAIKQTDAEMVFETGLTSLELATDAERLQQLLINLLVNATKFTKEGSITLKLEQTEDGKAQFSVTDTGCGIPLEKQAHIFGRFEKLDEKAQGTGLGLSICQLIIKRLNGDIWVDSSYTKGSRFVFVHPITQEARS
ncbi:HAMP domain-containing sensor histidine kinase [uncultured Bacteroides sp.]|uniref:sensor histidine kinase n=1 Tax=uncultured Bacteroides sp. TaxID=162156 RepID=UPI00258E6672|nr:HAMP domain-containing sensor histidine kinase [uncultured Bacteroides sp.]